MSINNRLLQIQKYYKLNNSEFAEILNISAASLSHIYKGRNNPSLPIFEAIARHYPDINLGWLVTGNEEMLINKFTENTNVNTGKADIFTNVDDMKPMDEKKKADEYAPIYEVRKPEPIEQETDKEIGLLEEKHSDEIVQIITVYANGEFSILRPRK